MRCVCAIVTLFQRYFYGFGHEHVMCQTIAENHHSINVIILSCLPLGDVCVMLRMELVCEREGEGEAKGQQENGREKEIKRGMISNMISTKTFQCQIC